MADLLFRFIITRDATATDAGVSEENYKRCRSSFRLLTERLTNKGVKWTNRKRKKCCEWSRS